MTLELINFLYWLFDTGISILSSIIASKAVPNAINSRALNGEKPCINNEIHALLMHGQAIFNMLVPGLRK